jgi:hypothetical protein
MYTSAGKPIQQERKVYPQVKHYEYAISLSWDLILQDHGKNKCKVVTLVTSWKILEIVQEDSKQVMDSVTPRFSQLKNFIINQSILNHNGMSHTSWKS